MATEVDICNLALSHFGNRAEVIAITPPDGSKEARLCSLFYPIARDALLEKRDWGFARRRAVLADLGSPPAEWLYRYAYPANILKPRALQVSGAAKPITQGGYPFVIENDAVAGTVILTNVATAELWYTISVTEVGRYPASFRDALSYWLASYLVGPLTQDRTAVKDLRATALTFFGEAAMENANIEKQQTKDNINRQYPISAPRRSV